MRISLDHCCHLCPYNHHYSYYYKILSKDIWKCCLLLSWFKVFPCLKILKLVSLSSRIYYSNISAETGKHKFNWFKNIEAKEKFKIQTSLCYFELVNFFCFSEENVKKYTGKSDPIDVMGALRQDKDKFKPKH